MNEALKHTIGTADAVIFDIYKTKGRIEFVEVYLLYIKYLYHYY